MVVIRHEMSIGKIGIMIRSMEEMMMINAHLEEMGFKVQKPQTLLCDNNSAVMTYATEVPEWRSPTLATKYWHSRDYIDGGDITIKHTPGEDNNSDIHTKWLPNPDHLRHSSWLGLYEPALQNYLNAAAVQCILLQGTNMIVHQLSAYKVS